MKTNDIEKGTVLIVDDQPEDMQVLISSLQACGLAILVAQQGEHAIDLAEQFTPDVILLDVLMPGMDGFETCRRLRACEATHAIPIIFMLASSETVDQAKGFEVGGMDYLTKPFQPREVMARVTAYLTIRKLQQQLQEQQTLVAEEHQWPEKQNFREVVEAYEKRVIANALAQNLDNTAKTAASLGLPLRTLYRKIKKYRLL
jgi:two-component system cell cycle sensor histidine kinase/response regulator CckA